MNQTIEVIDARLDELEHRLPALPAAMLRLQRTITEQMLAAAGGAFAVWRESARSMSGAANTAVRTVTGTARWAGGRTADTAATAMKTVAGQASAQARRTRDAIDDETDEMIDAVRDTARAAREKTVDAVEAAERVVSSDSAPTGESYEDLTKDELYRRAQAADIEGRSQMNKDELIVALRRAA